MSTNRASGITRFMFSANCSQPALPKSPSGLEVVDDHEPALLQVARSAAAFASVIVPPADLDDVGQRILEELGIVQRERVESRRRARRGSSPHS